MKHIIMLMLLWVWAFTAQGQQHTFYGSINLGLEYRDLKDNDLMDDHMQLQDAYSAIGITGEQELSPGLVGFYNYKLSIDVTSGNLYESPQTTWGGPNQDESVAYVGVKGDFGQASFGYQWNAYYNAISWTTDRFSSGWTGFDTYGSFQIPELMVYQSPDFSGLTLVLNLQSGLNSETGKSQDRVIAAASYRLGEFTLHGAYDNLGAGDTALMGMAAEYSKDGMRLAMKHEINKDGLGADDASLTTLHASFTSGSNTYKAHFTTGNYPSYLPVDDASGEQEASEIAFGVDHVINEKVYVFAEFHMSDEYCAYDVTEGNGNGGYDAVAGNEIYGCQVISVGTHYSF